MSTLALALSLAISSSGGAGIYRCRNIENSQKFMLIYEVSDGQASRVALRVDGVPNLPYDLTQWHGSIEPDGVKFSYGKNGDEGVTTGTMTLTRNPGNDQEAALEWTVKVDAGGMIFEEPLQSASCKIVVPGSDEPQ